MLSLEFFAGSYATFFGALSVRLTIFLLAAWGLFSVKSASTADELDAEMRAQWRHVFDGVAANYNLIRASENRGLALVDRPTYTWARSGAHGGTYGAVY